jgi:hypothetical protein
VEGHGIWCGSISYGCRLDLVSWHTGYLLHFRYIKTEYPLLIFFKPFCPPGYEVFIGKAFSDDVVHHHIQDGHIGSRPEGEVVSSISRQFGSPWIDHDGRVPVLHSKLLQLGTSHRVSIRWIGTYHHDAIGMLEVLD